jgi:hypothetical protein
MRVPRKLGSYIHRVGVVEQAAADRLRRELEAQAGVVEVVVVPEEGVAYLKVDRLAFDAAGLPGSSDRP